MEERPYYEAYDDRYRQAHGANLAWAAATPTPILRRILEDYDLDRDCAMLELGCGEGRDAARLLEAGYSLLATDVSPEAIRFCRERNPAHGDAFQVLDCVRGQLPGRFDFIYAVAVVHMLVEDEDRDRFYRFLAEHLKQGGIGLVLSMGDGTISRASDPKTAFALQKRYHMQSGKEVFVAGTSCRMVDFPTFLGELRRNGLRVIERGITYIPDDFGDMGLMYGVVTPA